MMIFYTASSEAFFIVNLSVFLPFGKIIILTPNS